MSGAVDTVRGLAQFPDRGAGTDAERRAAAWLRDELRRTGQEAELQTFWCRPNWALAQAWHVALGVAGSLVAVGSPKVGAGIVLAALLCVLADAGLGLSPGRRLTPEHASQNVVSPPPGPLAPGSLGSGPPAPARGAPRPRVRVLITANLDAGRQGLVHRPSIRRAVARLRRAAGHWAPGWAGWLALALVWVLVTGLLRAEGDRGTAVAVAQLIPTVSLVIGLALLLELGTGAWSPAAGDNGSGVAVAVALARALAAAPPAHMAVELLITGAGDGEGIGLRRHLRRHRATHTPATTVVLGFGPSGSGRPAWLGSDGALVPLGFFGVLRGLARRVAAADPGLGLREVRRRGASPALAARQAGLPALGLGALDSDGLVPRSHRPEDTPDHLDPATIDRMLGAALLLADEIDAHLGGVRRA